MAKAENERWKKKKKKKQKFVVGLSCVVYKSF